MIYARGVKDLLCNPRYGGQYTGQAVADALFGTYNPGGALSFSWFAERFAKLAPYMSMEMRPNATSGSPGRTHRFFDAEECGPECLSWPFVSAETVGLGR